MSQAAELLRTGKHQDLNIQISMLQAGMKSGKKLYHAAIQNPSLPENLWFNASKQAYTYAENGGETTDTRTKLVAKNLTWKQKQYILNRENSSTVLEELVHHNHLTETEVDTLLQKNMMRVHVALAEHKNHRQTTKQRMRNALYKAGNAGHHKTLSLLGYINREELAQNPHLKAEQLESANKHNIEETFKLVNKHMSEPENLWIQASRAALLSSNPVYLQNLDLLNFNNKTRQTLLDMLLLCIPTKHVKEKIEKETAKQGTELKETYRQKLEKTGYGGTLQQTGEALYKPQNTETLKEAEQTLLNHLVKTQIANTMAILLLETHKETHDPTYSIDTRINTDPGEQALNYLLKKRTEHHLTLRETKTNTTQQKLLDTAGQKLGTNTEAWIYWLTLGWRNNQEAHTRIQTALKLAEQDTTTKPLQTSHT